MNLDDGMSRGDCACAFCNVLNFEFPLGRGDYGVGEWMQGENQPKDQHADFMFEFLRHVFFQYLHQSVNFKFLRIYIINCLQEGTLFSIALNAIFLSMHLAETTSLTGKCLEAGIQVSQRLGLKICKRSY
jgi:hypothetical protein